MLRERVKSFLRGTRSPEDANSLGNGGTVPHVPSRQARTQAVETRQSRGLEQFFNCFRDQIGLSILDLGGAYQENVNFITNLGHKFHSEDFARIFHETFGQDIADQANPGRIDYFLRQSLDYEAEQFDGVLAWDALEYMEPPLLAATVDRLLHILKPHGYLMAIFHPADRKTRVPCYTFRIQGPRSLQVTQTGERPPSQQVFNNRGVEKIFQNFESIRSFLSRDSMREIIVRKRSA